MIIGAFLENLVVEIIRLLGLPGAVVVVNIYMIRSILASNEKKNHVISSHIEMSNDLLSHIAQEVKQLNDEILKHTEQCKECLNLVTKMHT